MKASDKGATRSRPSSRAAAERHIAETASSSVRLRNFRHGARDYKLASLLRSTSLDRAASAAQGQSGREVAGISFIETKCRA